MNIKITYNWLREYLDTDATAYELQKYLSLCGPSVETVEKVTAADGEDYVMDIEVTTNRIDMASVFGIAQEATAILPQFGKKAKLILNPLKEYAFENLNMEPSHQKELKIEIANPDLCYRFTAGVFQNVKNGQVPEVMKRRLELCDVNSINAIVDISNYIMFSLGQPTHMFDYNRIAGGVMKMRESKAGEKLITLDGKEFALPGGDIVIEDGDGRLVDLCGIMGGENSAITADTDTVIYFVQTYNKRKIRRTSMTTGQRSVAATYFEKGLDTERVEFAFTYGSQLLRDITGGSLASQVYDIYPHPYKPKQTSITVETINKKIGVEIETSRIISILENLGFVVESKNGKLDITIPSYRADDVDIPEDIVEEVARVYGYHALPNNLQPIPNLHQPVAIKKVLSTISSLKRQLKYRGLNELYNYSMVSERLLQHFDLDPKRHLVLANTISEDIKYLRTTLMPSLVQNIANNQGKRDEFRFFEIAKVYIPQEKELPDEKYKIALATNTDFFDIKGIIESIFREYHVENVEWKRSSHPFFLPQVQAEIIVKGKSIGVVGQIKGTIQQNLELVSPAFAAELDLEMIAEIGKTISPYQAPNPYATIYINRTLKRSSEVSFAQIEATAQKKSPYFVGIRIHSMSDQAIVLTFAFSHPDKNMKEPEAKAEMDTIEAALPVSVKKI